MGYKVTHPDIQEALKTVYDYEYALLYRISDVLLCRTEELGEEDWEECMEARIFSKDEELHILFGEDPAVFCVRDDPQTDGRQDIILTEYPLAKRFRRQLKQEKQIVVVKQYLDTDDDGQTTVALTCLADLK